MAPRNSKKSRSQKLRPLKQVVYEVPSENEEEEEEEFEEEYEEELEEEMEEEEEEDATTVRPANLRTSTRRKSKPSTLSEYVNIDEALRRKKKTKANKKKKTKGNKTKGSEQNGEDDVDNEETLRNAERRSLEATKRKRDQFYIHYRERFERLLPEKNYISKLVEKREKEMDGDIVAIENKIVPYKLLETQPEKVTATMKPYQLAGLSYLLWLYKNGTSGILGDEMGLGKTLQTLSLFSYLTTYEPVTKGHKRPFLVVCPLSVVSSWVSECHRWTPDLRCLRFHGPSAERDYLKGVATGSEEIFGEQRGYDVVVTTYEVFEREKAWFRRAFVWRYVVLD